MPGSRVDFDSGVGRGGPDLRAAFGARSRPAESLQVVVAQEDQDVSEGRPSNARRAPSLGEARTGAEFRARSASPCRRAATRNDGVAGRDVPEGARRNHASPDELGRAPSSPPAPALRATGRARNLLARGRPADGGTASDPYLAQPAGGPDGRRPRPDPEARPGDAARPVAD